MSAYFAGCLLEGLCVLLAGVVSRRRVEPRLLLLAGAFTGAALLRAAPQMSEELRWNLGSFTLIQTERNASLLALWYSSYLMVAPCAAWLLLRRSESLRLCIGLAALLLAGSLMNWLLPVAPPWAMGVPRAMDTFELTSSVVAEDIQPFAAWPSMHVAVPLFVALAARGTWAVYASVTAMVVVLAGEHWLADVGGAIALASSAYWLCLRFRAGQGSRRDRARLGLDPPSP